MDEVDMSEEKPWIVECRQHKMKIEKDMKYKVEQVQARHNSEKSHFPGFEAVVHQ